jgi:hypothetical protein
MLRSLLKNLYDFTNDQSCFVFNTGLGDYTRHEDTGYIDPCGRGHIVSYGWQAIVNIFHECGFSVHGLGKRNWSFVAEKSPAIGFDIDARIWNPLPDNITLLNDPRTGCVMQILARESLRAYLH